MGKGPLQNPASNSVGMAPHRLHRYQAAEERSEDVELAVVCGIRDSKQIIGQVGQRELATEYRRGVVEEHAAVPVSQEPDQKSIELVCARKSIEQIERPARTQGPPGNSQFPPVEIPGIRLPVKLPQHILPLERRRTLSVGRCCGTRSSRELDRAARGFGRLTAVLVNG
jgi:hypothetical protein